MQNIHPSPSYALLPHVKETKGCSKTNGFSNPVIAVLNSPYNSVILMSQLWPESL